MYFKETLEKPFKLKNIIIMRSIIMHIAYRILNRYQIKTNKLYNAMLYIGVVRVYRRYSRAR